jgi:thiol-disulfide isomerase/thioredoxin
MTSHSGKPRRLSPLLQILAVALPLAIGLAWVTLTAQEPEARPQDPPAAKPADPRAEALLQGVAKAYQALTSYSDDGVFTLAMTVDGKAIKQELPVKLTFVRPNRLDLDAGPVRLNCDGTVLTTTVVPLKRYSETAAPEKLTFQTFREGPAGAVLFGGPSGVPLIVLLNLLTATDPLGVIGELGGSLQMANDDPSVIVIDQQEGPDLRLAIDPATKLLSAIELVLDPRDLARAFQDGKPITIERFGWTAGKVAREVPETRSFAYQPPKDFSKVDSLLEQAGGEAGGAPTYAVQKLVGNPAPDFTLTLLDGPGKTRTVTKAELEGKVVVIDFWATWCGPCLIELPEIQKLVEAYAQDQKNVFVVALSQDSQPAELSKVRELVEKTLSEKKIQLTGNPVGQVGLDPSGSVGEAFDIEGYPTIVILDQQGIVRSTHVGYRPDIRERLTAEIDALLAGQSLEPGPNAEAR